jgi:hypothetical protein
MMIRSTYTFRYFAAAVLVIVSAVSADEPSAKTTFSATVDFGQDVGQSFGTLFEARDAGGQLVAGAGFQDVYNTRFRNDRHTLQFFVRPESADDSFSIERLPHPDLGCGVYLFDLNEQLYAWTSVGGNSVKRWDENSKTWMAELPRYVPAIRSGDGVVRIGNGQLTFANDKAWYDDRQILSPPDIGGYHDFYYAQGHLCFYHRFSGDDGFTKLYACAWTPSNSGAIDITKAVVFVTPFNRETPFAWGQWQDQVVTVSNMGGIYVFEDGKWSMTLKPDDKTSYQVYSALQWQDRVLLAQYPTGNVFEYRGTDATRLNDWPPVLPGVASSARECQTLSIYRGDLLAGVWPWAELWRRNPDREQWIAMGRMFTHPETTAEYQHPYETEAKSHKLVANHWGQRVTSMIPQRDSLYLSTSSKGTVDWKDEYKFLSDQQRREYGSVLRLRMPGALAAPIKWHDHPTRFTFSIEPESITIHQDGELLATGQLPNDFDINLSELSITWGDGTYGPVRGTLTKMESE